MNAGYRTIKQRFINLAIAERSAADYHMRAAAGEAIYGRYEPSRLHESRALAHMQKATAAQACADACDGKTE